MPAVTIDAELEANVIATLLDDPDTYWDVVAELRPEHFGREEHRAIYRAMQEIAERTHPTYGAVRQAVAGNADVRQALDAAYSSGLPSPGMIREWIMALDRWRQLREAYRLARRLQAECEAARPGHVPDVAALLAESVERIAAPTVADRIVRQAEWTRSAYESAERTIQASREGRPAYWGFGDDLSRLGEAVAIRPGNLLVIAGDTGHGKSTLAANLAVEWGIRQGRRVLYANTEMERDELGLILASIAQQASVWQLRVAGPEAERELSKIYSLAGKDGTLDITDPLWDATAERLCALARAERRRHGLECLVVDYVQRLADYWEGDRDKGWQVLWGAAKRFKSLAQELGIVVVMVAQLSGAGTLAGSRGMAREADAILRIERQEDEEQVSYVVGLDKSRHTPDGRAVRCLMLSNKRLVEVDTGVRSDAPGPSRRRTAPRPAHRRGTGDD
ncbi:MAG: AAA family ATPase [Firmicutes bacterium]|nr:AAA family ATPase [Bacillota bacterium]MBE3590846.1 AAA family ATPase [Bacillota bacterium]